MDGLSSYELNDDELREFAEKLSKIAANNNIKIGSCAEKIDLDECGIIHNCCIDRELIEKLSDVNLMLAKTKISVKNVDALKALKQVLMIRAKMDVHIAMQIIVQKVQKQTLPNMILRHLFYVGKFKKMTK